MTMAMVMRLLRVCLTDATKQEGLLDEISDITTSRGLEQWATALTSMLVLDLDTLGMELVRI